MSGITLGVGISPTDGINSGAAGINSGVAGLAGGSSSGGTPPGSSEVSIYIPGVGVVTTDVTIYIPGVGVVQV